MGKVGWVLVIYVTFKLNLDHNHWLESIVTIVDNPGPGSSEYVVMWLTLDRGMEPALPVWGMHESQQYSQNYEATERGSVKTRGGGILRPSTIT